MKATKKIWRAATILLALSIVTGALSLAQAKYVSNDVASTTTFEQFHFVSKSGVPAATGYTPSNSITFPPGYVAFYAKGGDGGNGAANGTRLGGVGGKGVTLMGYYQISATTTFVLETRYAGLGNGNGGKGGVGTLIHFKATDPNNAPQTSDSFVAMAGGGGGGSPANGSYNGYAGGHGGGWTSTNNGVVNGHSGGPIAGWGGAGQNNNMAGLGPNRGTGATNQIAGGGGTTSGGNPGTGTGNGGGAGWLYGGNAWSYNDNAGGGGGGMYGGGGGAYSSGNISGSGGGGSSYIVACSAIPGSDYTNPTTYFQYAMNYFRSLIAGNTSVNAYVVYLGPVGA